MSAPILVADVNEIVAPSPKVTGGVRVAPLGTALPTDATTALDPAYISLGRTSDTGIEKNSDRPKTDKYDWGGSLIASLQDHFALSLKFNLLQLVNADVQRVVYGEANVDVTPATVTTGTQIASKINANLLDQGVYVIDAYFMKMSGRLVLPIARPVTIGPVKWVHKDLAMFDLTLMAFPDNDNNFGYEYWDDGVTL